MSRVSAGDVYWIVACSAIDHGRENIYSILRSRVQKHGLATDSAVFDAPLNIKFRSLDELIRCGDDLVKYDATCEQITHRLERQILDLSPDVEIVLYIQRQTMSMEQLLHRFMWDDAHYSRSQYLSDHIETLMASIARIDDEVRIKSAAYNESKQSHSSMAKKEGSTFVVKDLSTVLTPAVVRDDDFIESKHLTTLVVIVRSGQTKDWLSQYESLDPMVIPRSTRKFDVADKEGNTLWKVTILRKGLESFKLACRKNKFTVREFSYTPHAAQAALELKNQLEAEKSKLESFLLRVCLASFSDAFMAWLHIKAMRVFVESTLRFGVPPNFAAFLVKPRPGREKKLRKELEDLFTTEGMFGRAFIESSKQRHRPTQPETPATAEVYDEEYYSYVSLSLTPFQYFSQK